MLMFFTFNLFFLLTDVLMSEIEISSEEDVEWKEYVKYLMFGKLKFVLLVFNIVLIFRKVRCYLAVPMAIQIVMSHNLLKNVYFHLITSIYLDKILAIFMQLCHAIN